MLIEYISNYTECKLNTLSEVRLITKKGKVNIRLHLVFCIFKRSDEGSYMLWLTLRAQLYILYSRRFVIHRAMLMLSGVSQPFTIIYFS